MGRAISGCQIRRAQHRLRMPKKHRKNVCKQMCLCILSSQHATSAERSSLWWCGVDGRNGVAGAAPSRREGTAVCTRGLGTGRRNGSLTLQVPPRGASSARGPVQPAEISLPDLERLWLISTRSPFYYTWYRRGEPFSCEGRLKQSSPCSRYQAMKVRENMMLAKAELLGVAK